MAPSESDAFGHDLSDDADCQGAGVIISNVVTTINAADDDGLLTVGAPSIAGLTFRQPVTADPDTTQRLYMLDSAITLSDGRTLHRYWSLPVLPTVALNA